MISVREERVRTAVARFDALVDEAFDELRGQPVVDRLFYAASELGDFSLVWLLLSAVRGLRDERAWDVAVRVGIGLALESLLVNGLIKSLFARSRPPWEVHRPRRLRRPRTSSFPSGHATSAFTAAALLSDGTSAWPLYYALAVVVAVSRIHVRIHHASDVLGGVAVGVLLGGVARRLAPLPDRPGTWALRPGLGRS